MHPLARQVSRRSTMQVLAALGLGAVGAMGSGQLADAGRRKKKRRCRRRTRECRRQNRVDCANCHAEPPSPPPPNWTGTAEEWAEFRCDIICMDLCSLTICFDGFF